jgi:hypothetical protein
MSLTKEQQHSILKTLRVRFIEHKNRHANLLWENIEVRLSEKNIEVLHSMESTGGEPDVIGYDSQRDAYIFCDCSAETPSGRRNTCYDRQAMDSRKENKPTNNALDMANNMGIELLTEDEYRQLQLLGPFDTKTSSWLMTPAEIRAKGGAIFGDFRYGHTFVYHNGAQSYYSSRGFRGLLRV